MQRKQFVISAKCLDSLREFFLTAWQRWVLLGDRPTSNTKFEHTQSSRLPKSENLSCELDGFVQPQSRPVSWAPRPTATPAQPTKAVGGTRVGVGPAGRFPRLRTMSSSRLGTRSR